jgi:hypothetical protein
MYAYDGINIVNNSDKLLQSVAYFVQAFYAAGSFNIRIMSGHLLTASSKMHR